MSQHLGRTAQFRAFRFLSKSNQFSFKTHSPMAVPIILNPSPLVPLVLEDSLSAAVKKIGTHIS